jgi:HK97 gp10 family phage protein
MAVIAYRRSSAGGVIVNWNGDDVKRRAESLASKSSYEIGLEVQGLAKNLSPVDTGRLRGSIMVASSDGRKTLPESVGSEAAKQIASPDEKGETFVGTAVEYGPYVEYGTRNSSAQPFLRPALDIAKGRVPEIVQRGAKQEFGEYLNPRGIFSQTNEAFTE